MHGWLVHCGYCQANITCRTSSNPDLIQNYFLSTEIFSSLDIHSEQMSQCASSPNRHLPDVVFLKMSHTIWASIYIRRPKRAMPKYTP